MAGVRPAMTTIPPRCTRTGHSRNAVISSARGPLYGRISLFVRLPKAVKYSLEMELL